MSKIQIFVIDDSDEEDIEKPRYSTIIEEEPYEDDQEEPQPISGGREYKTIHDEDSREIPDVKGWDPHEPNFFHIQ
jgi:hypothetical protein